MKILAQILIIISAGSNFAMAIDFNDMLDESQSLQEQVVREMKMGIDIQNRESAVIGSRSERVDVVVDSSDILFPHEKFNAELELEKLEAGEISTELDY